MPDTIEATSPAAQAKSGDAKRQGSSNLSEGQAAMLLFAATAKTAPKPEPTSPVAEETAPESTGRIVLDTPPTESAAEAPIASESAPTEEPVAAETTEAAPITEDGADTVPSQTISFTPEQQEIFNRRLGKELAKTKAIQSQMEEAKTKLAELEAKYNQRATEPEPAAQQAPAQTVVLGNQPLSNVNDFASLAQTRQTAKEAIRYVESVLDEPDQWRNLDVPDPKTGETRQIKVHQVGDKLWTEGDLKRSMREAKVTLEDHVPAREQFLLVRQKTSQLAQNEFPWLKDRTTPEYQQHKAALRDPANAWINALPNADYIAAVQIEGLKSIAVRKAAADAAAKAPVLKPKIVAKPPADQVASSASTAQVRQPAGGAERQALAAEKARLSKKGGINSEEAVGLLRQTERIRNSR